jgi:hypothetical protein
MIDERTFYKCFQEFVIDVLDIQFYKDIKIILFDALEFTYDLKSKIMR